ncbi:putative ATP-dependent RNA helicase TDRD12 [Plodia interpunctella]|uniref:putative ATP-dependent RNA helicase TDRD12 n=1 Tax=Plodia interpunctella TaxID=58824 RepID=UPI002367E5A9|nr:putative ATP-dependent RNA helicase TDRD12 [Plodia interpunctella]
MKMAAGANCYKVEILHYINPHLLWVEVENTKSEDFIFEQIGVYGLTPQEVTISETTFNVETRECEQWTPASYLVMREVFSDAQEIWFSPVHIDRRNSIFDDNIHKYGEIIVKKKNGKHKSLQQQLIKSGFAMYDTALFHQQLSAGKLKTKLNSHQKRDVIKQLEKPNDKPKKEWEKAFKKKTSIYHKSQNLESMLTVDNLRQHENIQVLLRNKLKDFERCKDIDEESMGRAVRRHTSKFKDAEVPMPSSKKKLELLKTKAQVSPSNTEKMLLATKKFLEQNAIARKAPSESSEIQEPVHIEEEKNNIAPKTSSTENKSHFGNKSSIIKKLMEKKSNTDVDNTDYRESVMLDNKNRLVEDYTVAYDALPTSGRPPKLKKKSKSRKIPEFDVNNEKRIAFGPPGLDRHKLTFKVVPKSVVDDDDNLEIKGVDNIEVLETPPCNDVFGGVDSEINVAITNKDGLIKCLEGITFVDKNNFSNINNDVETDLVPQRHEEKYHEQVNFDNNIVNDNISQTDSSVESKTILRSKILLKKLNLHMVTSKTSGDSLSSSDIAKDSSTSMEDSKENTVDSDDDIEDVLKKLNLEYHANTSPKIVLPKEDIKLTHVDIKNNVNPFKNVDTVFVDKLVTPVLMVHTKTNNRIQPCMDLRDVHFNTNIHIALTNMSVKQPKMIQSVSWNTILRGYSLFMISPLDSGKTMGYLPAVCRLVTDFKSDSLDKGPSCIIVCATAKAASEVERLSKMFLGLKEKVLTCYTGMDELHITTSLLNGCDLLICTPSILVRLMQLTDFGVDLRRLATFVLDDCERLSEVYINEVKFFLIKIKEMLKTRANRELKVQIVAASRIWCDFMGPLAKKAPNSVVCIGAFQECVLYSKANTTVNFVKNENKINTVMEFLKRVDGSKRTVIVCRDDKEVDVLEKCLLKQGKVVFACNNTMTVQDLYVHSKNWAEYQEPLLGPVLVCCDSNLIHLNVTNAHYLVHFSLPQLFSMFCKRFAVLNDNYASIFKVDDVGGSNVKIQVLLEDSNIEQLPKIVNFIKRCTDDFPPFLNDVCNKILAEKDEIKAKNWVPVCDTLLALGECPDFWNCQERHAILKQYDEPKVWIPKTGIVTFKILHYHSAVLYSARLLSNIINGVAIKYPQTYSTLSLKMGMYYSKESNKKLHGIPKVGDVCAVSVKLNFFARCQVMKILNYYKNGNPNYVLIKLIDEEKFERCSDVYLYYLPDELKNIETHIVRVLLANIKPKDKDITFSDLATSQLKKITDKQDLYLRGTVSLAIGNCVLVDTLEACQDLTSLNETVVNENFRNILLDIHAVQNPEHIPTLQKLCREGKLVVDDDKKNIEATKSVKEKMKPNWAHLAPDNIQSVFFTSAETPDTFFVRLVKFESCMNILLKDIDKYVNENQEPLTEVKNGDFVLAKFPDDGVYERARIDEVYEGKVKCFFVDQGDWRDILSKDLLEIPEKFLSQMPCQAIECRLAGVLPAGESWTEFGTNWFVDTCLEDSDGNMKQLYIKYFTKEIATHTEGHKYGVYLIDTYGAEDVVINKLMIDKNLAQVNVEEANYFEELVSSKTETTEVVSHTNEDEVLSNINEEEWENISNSALQEVEDVSVLPLDSTFLKKPIRSIPLVPEDDDDDDFDKWDFYGSPEFLEMFNGLLPTSAGNRAKVSEIIEEEKNKVQENAASMSKSDNAFTKENENDSLKENIDIKVDSTKQSKKEIELSKENVTQSDVDPVEKNTKDSKEKNVNTIKEIATTENNEEKLVTNKMNADILDSDDLSSADSALSARVEVNNEIKTANLKDELRKPKLIWRQHYSSVIIKIQLIVETYDLVIGDRSMKFEAFANDTKYGFYFELYGVIDNNSYYHTNKGQYILVNLTKALNKRWLNLTRDVSLKKWIVYDVDSIDTSSDEEAVDKETIEKVLKNMHDSESDSDDDFVDDSKF